MLDGYREAQQPGSTTAPAGPPSSPPHMVWLRDGSTRIRIEPADILWVSSAGNYVEYRLAGGVNHLVRGTLAAEEARLTRFNIVRVHRTRLVNLDARERTEGWPEWRLRTDARHRPGRSPAAAATAAPSPRSKRSPGPPAGPVPYRRASPRQAWRRRRRHCANANFRWHCKPLFRRSLTGIEAARVHKTLAFCPSPHARTRPPVHRAPFAPAQRRLIRPFICSRVHLRKRRMKPAQRRLILPRIDQGIIDA